MKTRHWIAPAILALSAYSVFLFGHVSYSMGGPDTSGYMNEARMIASGHMTMPIDLVHVMKLDDSWLRMFTPLGFAASPGGRMHPTYPPGLPMHIAVAGIIGGWNRAPFFVAPLAAIGALAILFTLGRKLGLPLLLAAVAPIVIAFFSPFLFHAVQPASDVLAMFWSLVAIYCAFTASERPWRAILAGAAFGIGVWVRPTNVLLILAFVLAMRCRPKLLLRAAIGAIPLGLLLMWWNSAQYGSPFRTGYGDVLSILSWSGVKTAGPEYVKTLLEMLTPVVFPIGLAVIFDKRVERWTRWMLFAWFAPFFVFYCFYGFWDGWTSVRFILPAIPALVLGAMILIRDLRSWIASRNVEVANVLAVAITLWVCVAPIVSSHKLFPYLPQIEEQYPRYIHWAEKRLPKGSLVVTGVLSGAFLYYENRGIVRYDQLDDPHFQLLRAYAGFAGLHWYAVLSDQEWDQPSLQKNLQGRWTLVDRLESISIYRLDS